MQLEKDKLDELAEYLIGTPHGIEHGLAACGLDDDYDVSELEDELLEASVPIERCKGCDWWFECGELTDDDGEPSDCKDCREEDE